jgi:hypothetical protein
MRIRSSTEEDKQDAYATFGERHRGSCCHSAK